MLHLDPGQVQRVVDGELLPDEAAVTHTHLDRCPDCREQLARARAEQGQLHALLGRLDHPLPGVTATELVQSTPRPYTRWRWVAGILLTVGAAGAAYAAPGSPLRSWLQSLNRPDPATAVQPASPDAGSGAAGEGSVAGIAVAPAARFLILFAATQSKGSVTVSVTHGQEVVVRSISGTAAFTSDDDRLLIDNNGSTSDYEIQLPRAARHIEIRVGSRRVFLKEDSRITIGTSAGTAGPYLIPLNLPPGVMRSADAPR